MWRKLLFLFLSFFAPVFTIHVMFNGPKSTNRHSKSYYIIYWKFYNTGRWIAATCITHVEFSYYAIRFIRTMVAIGYCIPFFLLRFIIASHNCFPINQGDFCAIKSGLSTVGPDRVAIGRALPTMNEFLLEVCARARVISLCWWSPKYKGDPSPSEKSGHFVCHT